MIVGSCIGVMYFAMFDPTAAYEVIGGYVHYLAWGVSQSPYVCGWAQRFLKIGLDTYT